MSSNRSTGKRSRSYPPLSRNVRSVRRNVPMLHVPRNYFSVANARTFSCRRTANYGLISSSSVVGGIGGALSFSLNSLPAYTEFTTLYDQYRIDKLVCRFMTTNPTVSAGALWLPQVLTASPDFDDSTTPTSEAVLLQYDKNRQIPAWKSLTMVIKPKAALAAYSGAFTSFGQSLSGQYFDCASPGIQFYGLKWWAQNTSGSTDAANWNLYVDYYMTFKSTR